MTGWRRKPFSPHYFYLYQSYRGSPRPIGSWLLVSFKKSCILSDYRIRARWILTITIMQESWKNELFIFTSFIDLHGNNGKNFLDKTRYYLVIKKFESQEIKSIICFYYPQYDHHHHYYYQCCCHHYDSYHAHLNNSLLAQF